ncbi:MAG: hypothetical protein IJ767_06920 [Bacteroidaceae bacterium]|nr:hypothetical protein [Bacteroidaceae bacterium]
MAKRREIRNSTAECLFSQIGGNIPNPKEYLSTELNEFFNAHQYLKGEMTKLRAVEEAKSK